MKIVIMGAGKIGRHLCTILNQDGHELCLIEKDAAVLDRVLQQEDIRGVLGNGSSFGIQQEAEVGECDVFVALTHDDDTNLMACVIAQTLGAKFRIARVRSSEYAIYRSEMRNALGIQLMVNPERLAAREIVRMIEFPHALSVEPFVFNRVNLVEIQVPADHLSLGMSLAELRPTVPEAIVCLVERGEEVFVPSGSTTIMAGDRLYWTGTTVALSEVYRLYSTGRNVLRSILIVGGGRITHNLLKFLERSHLEIKVIEQKEDKAKALAAEFPQIYVAQGDGTDQDFLISEGIADYDCTLALTGVDEENLLLSLFSASCGVPRNVTKVNRRELLKLLQSTDIQSVLTPYELATTEITRVIRSLNQDDTSDMQAMYRIAGGKGEALQFEVNEGSRVCGIPIAELKLKPQLLFAYIVRGSKFIIPTGQDTIEPGDRVIVVGQEQSIVNLDDVLEV